MILVTTSEPRSKRLEAEMTVFSVDPEAIRPYALTGPYDDINQTNWVHPLRLRHRIC